LQKRKVGLALSSGAAAGFAHIGVLSALEKEGVPIDMIAGTSTGALIGALYAQDKDINEIKNMIIDLGRNRVAHVRHLFLTKLGLIRGERRKYWLRELIGDIEFRDLRIPLACVATDILTGEEVIIKEGSVVKGVRASGSFPVIVPLVRLNGRYLVDGGLVNPVPVSVLRKMGADFIIAVNAIADRSKRPEPENKKPNIFKIIKQTIHISRYQTVRASLDGADIVIEPRPTHLSFGDWHRAEESILRGELAAQNSIPEIKRLLEA